MATNQQADPWMDRVVAWSRGQTAPSMAERADEAREADRDVLPAAHGGSAVSALRSEFRPPDLRLHESFSADDFVDEDLDALVSKYEQWAPVARYLDFLDTQLSSEVSARTGPLNREQYKEQIRAYLKDEQRNRRFRNHLFGVQKGQGEVDALEAPDPEEPSPLRRRPVNSTSNMPSLIHGVL